MVNAVRHNVGVTNGQQILPEKMILSPIGKGHLQRVIIMSNEQWTLSSTLFCTKLGSGMSQNNIGISYR